MRQIINMNQDWWFIHEKRDVSQAVPGEGVKISLPHTWNAVDGHDGNGSYDRGCYWYVKTFQKPEQPVGGTRLFIEILAAGQQADVYVNGQHVTYHEGGYSAFRADITEQCKVGENTVAIACSNEARDNVYPQSADFTFYGGLYRGVNLICVPEAHFDLEHYGDEGILVTPKARGECNGAEVKIVPRVVGVDENYTVLYSIRDADGQEIAGGTRAATEPEIMLYVPAVERWDIENPYLYTVTALLQRRNETCDEVSTRFGVRSFACHPERGFILNGVEVPLRGVSRHQDKLYQGNALTKEDHRLDAELIQEIGANTVRLAHYQHARDFYEECDERGFVVWAEIPFISIMNQDPGAHENCIQQLKELIYQNYNHPSICFWGISNEILIGGISEKLVENHKELHALAKEIDPTRLTTIAHVTMTPTEGPMHGITDVESYNHYFGWYGGRTEDNGPWMDRYHREHPEICIGLSEYGCEGILTYHSDHPACKDYSEAYQAQYHEYMAKMLEERPWIWSSHVWNMFDFGCAARDEGGVAGRNNKGLVTMDRKVKKDSFFLYKAYWNKEPMVHICGRRYASRAGEETEVRIYTNQPKVTLFINCRKLGEREVKDHIAVFSVPLEQGINLLVAEAGTVRDSISLEKVAKEPDIYVLPEVNERAEGVANWFKEVGDMDLRSPMEFPEGYYNIRCTMEELSQNSEAMEIVSKAIKLVTNMTMKPGEGMWDMMKKMTPEGMKDMIGSMMPDGFLESINAKLIKIEKES